jgi:hypothetical protein
MLTFADPKPSPDAKEHALVDFGSLGEPTPLSMNMPF